jgi:hypothetical protein
MALEAYFRLQRIDDDLDRIYAAGMLLEGRPAKWFGTYLCKINPKEARRHKAKFVEDPTFKQWETFENGLRESFGGRVDRNAAVDEWNRLRYQGSIDEFIDEISRLQWITNYQDAVIKDKLRVGLSGELAKEWSRVHPKPDSVNGQMTLLREIGHAIEDHNKLEASRRGRKDRAEHHREDRQPNRQSNHRSKKNRKANGKPFGQKDHEPPKPVSRFERALQGVSQEVRAKRKKEGVCLKCGKSGHGWADCRPNGQTGEKRKESSSGGETSNSVSKKPKTAAAVQAAPEPSTEVGRIMEIPDDEIDIDIWGDD